MPQELPDIVLRPTIPAYFSGCSHESEGSDAKAMCSARKLGEHISRTLRYPDAAAEEKIEGVVVLSFVVTDSGRVRNVRVLRDIGGGCGAEAQRVIEASPKWDAAIHRGRMVATQFQLPITFNLRTGLFDYELHIGDLPDGDIYRGELLGTIASEGLRVTDPRGEDMTITEVIYTLERGGEREQFVTRGAERPDAKKFAKFIGRKPARLTVEANVVEGLDIRAVTKSFSVVK